MSLGWLPGLSLGVLKLAFSTPGDGWGDHPGDISVSLLKSLCIYLPYTLFKDGGRGDHSGDIYVLVIILLLYSYLLYRCFRNTALTV